MSLAGIVLVAAAAGVVAVAAAAAAVNVAVVRTVIGVVLVVKVPERRRLFACPEGRGARGGREARGQEEQEVHEEEDATPAAQWWAPRQLGADAMSISWEDRQVFLAITPNSRMI